MTSSEDGRALMQRDKMRFWRMVRLDFHLIIRARPTTRYFWVALFHEALWISEWSLMRVVVFSSLRTGCDLTH